MIVNPIKTRIFREGEGLIAFIHEHVPSLKERSVLAVTSKIVALAENRTADASQKEQVIKDESEIAMKTKHVWLTIKDGIVMANAGVDSSNADGKIVLLPRDSFRTAHMLRTELQKEYGIVQLGIIITDSRTNPLRAGVTGAAIGYAGFKAVHDYRSEQDLFGRSFEFTRLNVADSLATAATLEMGEGAESQPLAIIEKAPIVFADAVDRNELLIPLEDDMYGPLFRGEKSLD